MGQKLNCMRTVGSGRDWGHLAERREQRRIVVVVLLTSFLWKRNLVYIFQEAELGSVGESQERQISNHCKLLGTGNELPLTGGM